MNKKCPKCGHQYDPDVSPELNGACPRCMAELLRSRTGDASAPAGEDDAPPLGAGARLGKFEVLEYLGRGGMGFVYKAKQAGLDRTVALKVLAPRLAASPEFAARFDREAKALASLSHPNIVQVHDYGQENGLYFLVMEYVDGTSLRRILSTQRIKPETALRYVPQICDALEYAHSSGVIHRDIKPENILIDKRGSLKIADFGLAKMVVGAAAEPDAATEPAGHATVSGQVMGTPHYMAPEQVENTAAVDHRADIYSLGVVFYEMLTGELPLGRFPAPSQRVHVDVRFDEVVLKALEKEPEKRYQQASFVKEDVSRITGSPGPGGRARVAEHGSLITSSSRRGGLLLRVGTVLIIMGFLLFGLTVVEMISSFRAIGSNHNPQALADGVSHSLRFGIFGMPAFLMGIGLLVAGLVLRRRQRGSEKAGGKEPAQEREKTPPVSAGGPRMSKLAVTSALCLPAAIIVGILAGVLAHLASGREHPSETTAWVGVLSGTAILLIGLLLGVAAFAQIRGSDGRISGRGFAWVGVLQLPVVWFFLFVWLMQGSTAAPDYRERPTEHPDELRKEPAEDISWGQPMYCLQAGLAVKQAKFEAGKPMEFLVHLRNDGENRITTVPPLPEELVLHQRKGR